MNILFPKKTHALSIFFTFTTSVIYQMDLEYFKTVKSK